MSGIVSGVLVAMSMIGTFKLCGGKEYGICMENLHSFMVIFLPFLPLFIFSLITYKMREATYLAWFNFAKWWIPLAMLSILIAPQYSHDWLFPIDKGRVAFLVSLLFVIVSSILIAYKSYQLRKK